MADLLFNSNMDCADVLTTMAICFVAFFKSYWATAVHLYLHFGSKSSSGNFLSGLDLDSINSRYNLTITSSVSSQNYRESC